MNLFLFFAHVIVTVRVNELAPVKRTRLKRVYKCLGSSYVCSEGDIVNVAKAEKILLTLVNLSRRVGASEIEHKVNLVIGNTRGNLVGAARASRKECFNLKSCRFGNIFSR